MLVLSVHICLGLVVEYWPIMGTCRHAYNHSKLCHSCHPTTLFSLLPPPTGDQLLPSWPKSLSMAETYVDPAKNVYASVYLISVMCH